MKKYLKITVNFSFYLIGIMLVINPIFSAKLIRNATAEPKGSLRIGLAGEIDRLEPNDTVNRSTQRVVQQIFETLITADDSMNFHPLLATSWEITPDGKALTFNLRRGVKFHDGTSFDSSSVKLTFDRMKNQKLKRWSLFSGFLESVEVINEYTAKMNLKGSPNTALTVLSIAGQIECPIAVEKYGKDFGLHPVGTGPFRFVEWISDQRVLLEANKVYWGGEPKLAQVIFKPVPDPHTRLAMIEAGDLDVVEEPPFVEIERLKLLSGIRIEAYTSGTMLFLAFNTVKPPFNDKNVRQAISHSIDRKSIVSRLLFGRVHLAETYASSNVKEIVKYNIYPYNPEKSKSILANLGWKLGKSGFLEKEGEVFKTAIVTPSGRYPMDRQIAEVIQSQLKKIGIDAKVMILEAAAFIKAVNGDPQTKKNADFGMLILSRPMGPDPDSSFTQHFHSGSFPPKASNSSIFSNNELDRTLEEAAKTIDENKRRALYKKAQDILNEEVPWLPIYSYTNFLVLRKDIKGVGYPNPFSFLYVSKEAQIER